MFEYKALVKANYTAVHIPEVADDDFLFSLITFGETIQRLRCKHILFQVHDLLLGSSQERL